MPEWFTVASLCLGVATAFAVLLGLIVKFWQAFTIDVYRQLMREQPMFAMGVPFAITSAIVLVAGFRAAEGLIKVKISQIEFEGASTTIVMWMLAYLAIVLGMKTLWVKKTEPSSGSSDTRDAGRKGRDG